MIDVEAMIRNLAARLELVEAKFEHPALAEMLRPDLLKVTRAKQDHPVLERIYAILGHSDLGLIATCRQADCLNFYDANGKRYEIVVREIDGDDEEEN
jgi:hypothetical protein